MKFFIDTNVPMYAAGKEHPLKNSCLKVLESIAKNEILAFTDTEVFQEILYRFFSIRRKEIGLSLFDGFVKIMHGAVMPVGYKDIMVARELAGKKEYENLQPRDIIHLSVMINHGIETIITADKEFEKVGIISVIHPEYYNPVQRVL